MDTIFGTGQPAATSSVNLVIAIRLGISVNVILGHSSSPSELGDSIKRQSA